MADIISISGPVLPSELDCPTRPGTKVQYVTDITDPEKVPNPHKGMLIYVENEDKYYKVKTLNENMNACQTYEEFAVGAIGALTYKGEVDSVEALSNIPNPKAGDYYNVSGEGGYVYAEGKRRFAVVSNKSQEFNLDDEQNKNFVVESYADNGKVTIITNSGDAINGKLYTAAVYSGFVVVVDNTESIMVKYKNGAIYIGADDGDTLIVRYTAPSWNAMNGNGVTRTEAESLINTAKSEVSSSLTAEIEKKQEQLTPEQLARLDEGCLASVDSSLSIIKVTDGVNTYYVRAEKLEAPANPTFVQGASIDTTEATVKITASCATSGAVIRYSTGDNDVTASSDILPEGGITIATAALDNETTDGGKINIRAYKNGMGSEKVSRTFTIYRKLSKPTISVDGTDYTTAAQKRHATITGKTGATIKYGTSSAAITSTYSGAIDVTASGTIYTKQTLTGWKDSDVAIKAIVVGKAYEARYGFVEATSITSVDQLTITKGNISSVKGGNTYDATIGEGTRKYFYIAFLKTLTGSTITVTPKSRGYDFPLEKTGSSIKKTEIGDYYVYRSDEAIANASPSVEFQ